MSKPCQGVILKSVKGSDLMREVKKEGDATEAPKKYIPPSARAKEPEKVKILTKEELDSDKFFPTLGAMKTGNAGASWAQIRSRLAPSLQSPPIDFKKTVECQMQDEEKGLLREMTFKNMDMSNTKDMTEKELLDIGWDFVHPPLKPSETSEIKPIEEEDYYNAKTEWTTLGITADVAMDPKKMAQFMECVQVGGAPIPRSNTPTIDYFGEKKPVSEQQLMFNASSEKRAKDILLAFVGGKVTNKYRGQNIRAMPLTPVNPVKKEEAVTTSDDDEDYTEQDVSEDPLQDDYHFSARW